MRSTTSASVYAKKYFWLSTGRVLTWARMPFSSLSRKNTGTLPKLRTSMRKSSICSREYAKTQQSTCVWRHIQASQSWSSYSNSACRLFLMKTCAGKSSALLWLFKTWRCSNLRWGSTMMPCFTCVRLKICSVSAILLAHYQWPAASQLSCMNWLVSAMRGFSSAQSSKKKSLWFPNL